VLARAAGDGLGAANTADGAAVRPTDGDDGGETVAVFAPAEVAGFDSDGAGGEASIALMVDWSSLSVEITRVRCLLRFSSTQGGER
jgi:hypothetical protein